MAYFRVSVEICIPNPLRCHNCQKYGHHENRCTKDPICANCGEPANQSCTKDPNCVNCGGKHSANAKACQVWHKEKEILTVKFTRNLSFPEARKIVVLYPYSWSQLCQHYTVTCKKKKKVTVEDAVTQTDPIPGLKPLEKLKPKIHLKNNSTCQISQQPTETNKTEKVLKNATLEMIKKDLKKKKKKKKTNKNNEYLKNKLYQTDNAKLQETT